MLTHILTLGISLEMLRSLFLSCTNISFLYLVALFFQRLNLIILKVCSCYCINLLCKPCHSQLIAIKRIFLYFCDFGLAWFDFCWTTTMIDTSCLEGRIELFNCLLPQNSTWKGHTWIYCLLPLLHFLLGSNLVSLCWVVSHWINSLYFLNKRFVSFIPLVSIQLLPLKWLQCAAFYSLLNDLCLEIHCIVWKTLLSFFFLFRLNPRLITWDCFVTIKFWIIWWASKNWRSFITFDSSGLKNCLGWHYLLWWFWTHKSSYIFMLLGLSKWVSRSFFVFSCGRGWFLSKSICTLYQTSLSSFSLLFSLLC